ncbi:MAG: YceI family protein [Litorilinea sp.]
MQMRSIATLMSILALLLFAACSAPTADPSTAPAAVSAAPEAESDGDEDAPDEAEADDATAADDTAADDTAADDTEEAPADASDDTEDTSVGLAGTRTFVISPEESEAAYIVTEELFADALTKYGMDPGFNEVRGTTQTLEGQFTLNFDDLSSALGENRFSVDMTTLSTDQRLRDGWIRSDGPSFDDYPVAEFVGSEIQGAPESYTEGEEVTFEIVGELTMREITQPKTFTVTATLEGNTITGVATTEGLLSEFGIEPISFAGTLTVADPLTIEINFVAHAAE